MAERCAVVGVGQTHFAKRRDDVSMPGLLREAIDRALEDAELTLADIDAVVIGKAPDAFEGIIQPELFLADALAPLAAEYGPTVDELAEPLLALPPDANEALRKGAPAPA